MKKKLGIDEYVFTYKKEKLKNATLECSFDTITLISYENGIRTKRSKPLINFNITANSNNKKYSFSFSIFGNLITLNNSSNILVNINDYIVPGEVFFIDDGTCKTFDDELKDNIYKYTPTFFVEKINDNKFVFKIQYDDIFIWFLSDFT